MGIGSKSTAEGLLNLPRAANVVRINKHILRKNHDLVAAMYAMYETGKSLEAIGKVYGRSRQAVYDVFRTRGYPLRTKQLRGLQVLDGIRFILYKNSHLRGTRPDGRRVSMHHYVWEKHFDKIEPHEAVMHLDYNPQNNAPENLQKIPKRLMGHIFNSQGKNQYSPGGSGLWRGRRYAKGFKAPVAVDNF